MRPFKGQTVSVGHTLDLGVGYVDLDITAKVTAGALGPTRDAPEDPPEFGEHRVTVEAADEGTGYVAGDALEWGNLSEDVRATVEMMLIDEAYRTAASDADEARAAYPFR